MNHKTGEKYDRSIYPVEIIRRAADMYVEICKIDINENKEETECIFYSENAELIKHEFGNFLIELLQQRSME